MRSLLVLALLVMGCTAPTVRGDPPALLAAERPRPSLAVDAIAHGSVILRNARLWDGTGGPVRPGTSLRIRAGQIEAIGDSTLDAQDLPMVDAGGATVLPGLIDSHVHLGVVPGAELRGDSPETLRALRRKHLAAYLACGVTTVLDTGIPDVYAKEIQRWIQEGVPAPRFLHLGPPIVPPGGYGSAFFAEGVAGTPEMVDRAFERIVGSGAIGVKVPVEDGLLVPMLPVHPPEIRSAIVSGARSRGLPLFVHALTEAEQRQALELSPYAFVHTAPDVSEAFARELARRGVYGVSTLALTEMLRTEYHPERLREPPTRLVVPEVELRTAEDPKLVALYKRRFIELATPAWFPTWLGVLGMNEGAMRDAARESGHAFMRLRAAGVRLVMGSDSGNMALVPFFLHGVTSLREMEAMAEAGMPPAEVLAAATRVPAEMLGLAGQVGTIEPGKWADLVIVEGDPLQDIRALRHVRWTVRGGVLRTPEEWMRAGDSTE